MLLSVSMITLRALHLLSLLSQCISRLSLLAVRGGVKGGPSQKGWDQAKLDLEYKKLATERNEMPAPASDPSATSSLKEKIKA